MLKTAGKTCYGSTVQNDFPRHDIVTCNRMMAYSCRCCGVSHDGWFILRFDSIALLIAI